MTSNRRLFAVATAISMVVAPAALAENDELRSELKEMREMVRALQDKVEAQDRQIQDQDTRLQEAGLAEGNDALSALSSFLESTDFYGSVAASYQHDLTFEDNNEGEVSGAFPYAEFNTFQLDQLWFGMDKAPTEESRGGFHVDIAYGASANGDTDTPEVYAAYASYLAPIGNGVQIDAGELWTYIGAEVVDTTGNFNVTLGQQWGLQPVNHVGATLSTELADGLTFAIGGVNDPFSDANQAVNTQKGVTGQIAYATDVFRVGVSGIWGTQDISGEGDKYGLIDLLVSADPTDAVSLWFDYNYNWYDDTPDAYGFGAASGEGEAHTFGAAVRVAVTEATAVAVRGELLLFDLGGDAVFDGDTEDEVETWSVTGTLEHALTDNVTARAEVRYDGASEDVFSANDGNSEDHQVLGIAQLIYAF